MHRIFIGADPRQAVSLTTLIHSITANAKQPVAITPLVLETLPLKRQGLTPFTYSRFLVPHLCDYQGPALFLDADMLVLGDISEVFDLARIDSTRAAFVMQDQPTFEWASMILFNCGHPSNKILTPEHVDDRAVTNLHKIGWLPRHEIGKIPPAWNVCVPYSYDGREPPADPKLVHFTQGVPHWWETEDQPYADLWKSYRADAAAASHTWWELMGRSVHAEPRVDALINSGKVADYRDYAVKAGIA